MAHIYVQERFEKAKASVHMWLRPLRLMANCSCTADESPEIPPLICAVLMRAAEGSRGTRPCAADSVCSRALQSKQRVHVPGRHAALATSTNDCNDCRADGLEPEVKVAGARLPAVHGLWTRRGFMPQKAHEVDTKFSIAFR